MNLDPVIIGFLGRALSFELSAVQQYLSLSKLMQSKGLISEAEKFKTEAQEEMNHVERIITRLIGFGCAPNASHLRPTRLHGSLVQILQSTSEMEKEAVQLYEQAVDYCDKKNDVESKFFFKILLKEEQEHHLEMESLVKSISNCVV